MNPVLSPCAPPSFVMPSAGTVGTAETTAEIKPEQRWKTLPTCGVVTIDNKALWSPKSVCAVPPSVCEKMGIQFAAIFAMAFNQSEYARMKLRWAVVTNRGTVLILNGIPAINRPINPADFPPCVRSGLTYLEAEVATQAANSIRHTNAIIPREWSISLRRADCVNECDEKIGGAAR